MIEALPSSQGLFSRRRVLIEHQLSQLEFTPDYREMTGVSADGTLRVTVNLKRVDILLRHDNMAKRSHPLDVVGVSSSCCASA